MIVIDAHAHYVPRHFPPCPTGVPDDEWPIMQALPDGRARMLLAGKEFRIFEPAYWDVQARIAQLDKEDVTLQVISPLPELLAYWLHAKTAAALAVHINSAIGKAVREAPDRLAGLGMLPLQDEAASLQMLPQLAALGLRGVLVASNVNGVSIADPRFYPILGELERLDMAVFVHGYRPAGMDRFIGSTLLGPIAGVPQDTAAAVASFITTDIFGKFPKLKLGFAHGGGSFGAVIDRMNHVWQEFPAMRENLATAPREYVRKFFFDTVTFGEPYLKYLIEVFGEDTLMAGSDGPTLIGQHGLKNFVTKACGGDARLCDQLLSQNAVRFFSLGT